MENCNEFTALLPMKGNSVRVPNKNLRHLAGQPLCYYILKQLSLLSWISEIIVNTDSAEIAELVLKLNPKIIIHWRDEEILGDDITMNSIIEKDLVLAKNNFILQTHATNPLLSARTLNIARDTFLANTMRYDSLFSVNRFYSRFFDSKFSPINHNPDVLNKTQDLWPMYEDNSCFYFFSKVSFAEKGTRLGAKPYFFVTPKVESIDIDVEEDFLLAEKLADSSRGEALIE